VAVLLAIAVSMIGCGEKTAPTIYVKSVSVTPSSISLTEGESSKLTATISPSDATNQSVSWSSSNSSIASVNNGDVSAIKAGTATITATTVDGGKTASCSVTVIAAKVSVTGVTLSKTSLELTEGESETLSATVSPDNATDKTVSWSSSDNAVATVADGKVTAVKPGTATITVTTKDGQKTTTCSVTVKAKIINVTGVSLSQTSAELKTGESITLTATVNPDNATDKSVSWESSNTKVATVDGGVVKAVAVGEATITVTTKDGSHKATCKVVVKPTDDQTSGDFPDAGWGDNNK